MTKKIIVERLGQSAIVTINNAPANLWTIESLQGLAKAMDSLSNDGSIRAVVITGAGERFFSAGADLSMYSGESAVHADKVLDAFKLAFDSIRQFPGMTVAAVNGYALGGGLECALSCDYIVAEKGVQLGLPETKVGLIPCAGGTKLLTDRIGVAWAKRLIMGGELVSAQKALQIGLVEEVVDIGLSKITALSLAAKVRQQSPAAVRAARALIEQSAMLSLDQQFVDEKRVALSLIGTEEQQAGIRAFNEKTLPPWCLQDDED